ncbi:MAG TPA: type IV toxin-antitoxin system AbiEi family antitoxin domain-containing protein [Candidatus Acidoferrum sp.]|nr:type IV toxin-antitoxin system AbiEi family antitoxin domain-containing protein [Candidatus Acidoferrum sp.]
MEMSQELRDLLEKNNGTITNKQAGEAGIYRERLRQLANSGVLERAATGVYISPDVMPDKMYVEQLRKPKMIYSHETALFLHDLTDRDPTGYAVTVPRGYHTTALSREGFTVYTVKRELHALGAVRMKTVFGNTVTAYGLERTICDAIRSRNLMDIAIVTEAVRRYVRRNDKNLNLLMQTAEVFRVTKPLRSYLEVLL